MIYCGISCTVMLTLLTVVFSISEDYYWRDYTGKIPEDAIVAGKDIHGSDLYIGQTYVRDKGLISVQINPGVKEVYACSGGIRKLDTHTKILCGPQSSFKWVPVTSTDFHTTLNHKRSVVGGHEDGHGEIGIGRINHRGESMIGKVNSFDSKCADFYFNNGGMEVKVDKYEILVFDDDENGQIGDDRAEDSGSFEGYHHYQHRPPRFGGKAF